MPCNSDYMMPTPEEIAQLGKKCEQLKQVADDMVYSADVIREVVLKTGGVFARLSSTDAVKLARRVAGVDDLIRQGNDLVEAIKKEYAYRNLGNSKPKGMIDSYLSIRAKLIQASAVGNDVLDDLTLEPNAFEALEQDQIEHRMEDVKRLIPIFTAKGDFKTVAKLAQVDFLKELEPQLGFSPDDF